MTPNDFIKENAMRHATQTNRAPTLQTSWVIAAMCVATLGASPWHTARAAGPARAQLVTGSASAPAAVRKPMPAASNASAGAAPISKADAGDPNVVREVKWDELIPKSWRPPRMSPSLGMFGDNSPEAEDELATMRAIWDAAPTVDDMNGRLVKLPGYVVPLEEVRGDLKEFLLVPYFGACIHTPPPPANQIVFVVPQSAVKGFRAMDTVWVTGRLSTIRQASYMGATGYRLDAVSVEPYLASSRAR